MSLFAFFFPLRRLGHENANEEGQQRGHNPQDHHHSPAVVRYQPGGKLRRQPERQHQLLQLPFDARDANPDDRHKQVADIGRRADQAGHEGSRSIRKHFHHQRDAQRPLAAHPQRRDEPQDAKLHRAGDATAQGREDRVGEHADGHRFHAANAIAQPPEEHPAGRGPDEE